AKRRLARLTTKIVISVAKLTGFQCFGIVLGELLYVDVLQICPGRGGKADSGGLEKLYYFTSITVNRAVSLVVDDEVEVERRELFPVATIHHQGLNSGDDNRGTHQFTCAACCLVNHWLELTQDDVEILHSLLSQFDAVHDKQDALGVASQ